MGKQDTSGGRFELTRRDFLKVAGAGAAAVAAMEPLMPAPAAAITPDAGDTLSTYVSTCPYCSAQCGQIVTVGSPSGKVYDIWGDPNSPTNRGGLCSKGAGSFQLVTNRRRIGVPEHTAAVDGKDMSGTAWKRTGNGNWQPIALATAMHEIVAGDGGNNAGLVAYRNQTSGWSDAAPFGGKNATTVQFFGSSHMNNEQNYLYRKIIADFGTSRVEHQARI